MTKRLGVLKGDGHEIELSGVARIWKEDGTRNGVNGKLFC